MKKMQKGSVLVAAQQGLHTIVDMQCLLRAVTIAYSARWIARDILRHIEVYVRGPWSWAKIIFVWENLDLSISCARPGEFWAV